jgi:hypothetical protein
MKHMRKTLAAIALVAFSAITVADIANTNVRPTTTTGTNVTRSVEQSGGIQLPHVGLESRLSAAADVHAPSSNAAAIVTYAAGGAGVVHVISGVAWSYSAAPTGGNLKVENGSGVTVFTMDISTGGAGFIPFPFPKKGSANTAMITTLAAGGSGITGKVSVLNHWTE